jgi:hypothetical protein
LLLALLLQAIYGIRSERMLIEQLDYNLLFRWFVGLNPAIPSVIDPMPSSLRKLVARPRGPDSREARGDTVINNYDE